ncbi:hypothetical protein HPB52_012365 [Rhipicephalus sanguineus]|uniref:Uncharacterized protein n=1 Tax=Rhipicephalus sanguineus TaxID=34632 RepID=A0A9D4SSG6_RHISA|nr:hypothetical protein HPB52_012365 [Rhipicephalus sanguineus]
MPINSPTPPSGTGNIMYPDLRAQVNVPAVLINRAVLYVIIAVLSVPIPVCACVLTYSFANNTRLKRNAEEMRQYIASSFGGAEVGADELGGSRDQPAATGGFAMADAHSCTAEALQEPDVRASYSRIGFVAQQERSLFAGKERR